MKRVLRTLLIAIAFSLTAAAQPARPAPITYELACPAGYSPVANGGKSFNTATGKWRANLCISDKGDGRMICQMNGCGATTTVAAGDDQQVQFNLSGAFGADPDFQWDYTDERLQIAGLQTIHGMAWTSSSFAATYDVPLSKSTVIVTAQDGQTLDVVMPDPATAYGQLFFIKREDGTTGTITIDPFGTETFDGAVDLPLVNQYQAYLLQATKEENRDNISWAILSAVPGDATPAGVVLAPSATGSFFVGPGLMTTEFPGTASAGVNWSAANQISVSRFVLPVGMVIARVSFLAQLNAPENANLSFAILSADGHKLVDSGLFNDHGFANPTVFTRTFTPVTLPAGTYWTAQTCDTWGAGQWMVTSFNADTFYQLLSANGISPSRMMRGVSPTASVGGVIPPLVSVTGLTNDLSPAAVVWESQ